MIHLAQNAFPDLPPEIALNQDSLSGAYKMKFKDESIWILEFDIPWTGEYAGAGYRPNLLIPFFPGRELQITCEKKKAGNSGK